MKVFFDLDGTLIDVAPRHYQVYTEVVKSFGGVPMPQKEYWQLKRKKIKWPELLRRSELSPSIEPNFLLQFIDKIEDPAYLKIDKPFPDALAALDKIAETNDCYLVSLRRKRENLLEQIELLQLAPHFAGVLTGHSESDGYDVKIALLRDVLDGGRGVIIGDTEADIVTGKELGLITIALKSGIRDESFLESLKPDYLIDHIGDVLQVPILQ